jgi:hypothetical protein
MFYVTREGDTLTTVAKKLGVSIPELLARYTPRYRSADGSVYAGQSFKTKGGQEAKQARGLATMYFGRPTGEKVEERTGAQKDVPNKPKNSRMPVTTIRDPDEPTNIGDTPYSMPYTSPPQHHQQKEPTTSRITEAEAERSALDAQIATVQSQVAAGNFSQAGTLELLQKQLKDAQRELKDAQQERTAVQTQEAQKYLAQFDPETGYPLNAAAEEYCVSLWTNYTDDDVLHTQGMLTHSDPRLKTTASSPIDSTFRVGYTSLAAATNKFNEQTHLLGRGGSCRVFKGDVYGHPTAIKVFNETGGAWDDKQYQTEIELLCKVRHPHLNRLYAICEDGPARCLVLEYCNGGALDDRLQQQGKSLPMMPWRERLTALVHVAKGLVYMHSLKPNMIVHRDVKVSELWNCLVKEK